MALVSPESGTSKVDYGKRSSSNCLQRLKITYEKYKSNPLPPVFKTRLDGPSSVWKAFKRLQMAEYYADSFTKDCMIFSYEEKHANEGQRMFLVTHPEHMWLIQKTRPVDAKCTYEVIRENYPCKLYFDLEFYTCYNPGKDGNCMTKIFIKCVIAAMSEYHNLEIKESDFLWLDASTDQKFSCHLILQMKDVAFKNNIQAGIFVCALMSTMKIKLESKSSLEGLWPSADDIRKLLIITKAEKEEFFCDKGVYSKNRNFRLYLSTKQGKKNPLVLSTYNQYISNMKKCLDKGEAIFYDSLVTYFRNSFPIRLLNYEDQQDSNIFPAKSFALKISSSKPGVSGCSSSPFPDCDNFVKNIIRDNIAVGFIRKWTYFCNEQKIIYDIGNYRFCRNIGRHHKSNNIRIIVDMKTKSYFQKCLDPDCRAEGFQSESIPLPKDILFLNVPDDFFDTDCFSELLEDENILIDNNDVVCSNTSEDFSDQNMYDDLSCGFESFTQLRKMCDGENKVKIHNASECKNSIFEDDLSWDNFFFDGLYTSSDNSNEDKNGLDIAFDAEDDIFNFSNTEYMSQDTMNNPLADVSLEEELLMAEAVAATEVSFAENMSEETIF